MNNLLTLQVATGPKSIVKSSEKREIMICGLDHNK